MLTVEPGWYYLGPAATNGSNDAVGLIIRDISDDGSILHPVGDWVKVWDNSGSGKQSNYALWKGVPLPEDQINYVVVGGFFVRSHDKPTSGDAAGIKAIHKDVLTVVDPGKQLWNDSGSKASKDGAVWNISVAGHLDAVGSGAFIPVEEYDNTPRDTYAIDRAKSQVAPANRTRIPVPTCGTLVTAHHMIHCDSCLSIVSPVTYITRATTKPLFQIKSVPYDNKINDDSGSGARYDIATWKPVRESPHFLLGVKLTFMITVEPGWYYLGPAATNGSNDAVGLIIRDISDDGSILHPVGDWVKVWDNSGSGKQTNYALWKGVPLPEDQINYVVIGGFFVRSRDKPTSGDAAGIKAIHKDVLTIADPGKQLWNDSGSKASKDGAVWNISIAGHLDAVGSGAFIPVEEYTDTPRDTYAVDRTKGQVVYY